MEFKEYYTLFLPKLSTTYENRMDWEDPKFMYLLRKPVDNGFPK